VKLRWYQRESCEAAWGYLCSQAGNPLVVLPTGAGKSIVIAELCRAAIEDYQGRVMILAHRSELIEQNREKARALLPMGIGIGTYSAGLRQRNTDSPVVLAGIQSVYKRAEEFGQRNLVIVDESHLVPHDGEGMYRTFLDRMREINPKLRIVGLTATPYRTGEGALCRRDGLFQKICYEASIPRLIEDGFLCPVTSRAADGTLDTSKLHVRGGEFVPGEVEALFDDAAKVDAAVREIVAKSSGRHSVLVFCSGIAHAEHVREALEKISGSPCGVVTGSTLPLERSGTLAAFKERRLRFLCNVDVLTTGFDAPCIDAIAILRATKSPGLFAQICGRGFRLFPGKENCLILDFGENIKRHGPVDAIDFGKASSGGGAGEDGGPTKTCPNCESEVPAGAGECRDCGWKFPRQMARHETEASQEDVLSTAKRWLVEEVRFSRHRKRKAELGDVDTLRVDYLCQPTEGGPPESISEWVCVDHPPGYANRKAIRWWKARSLAQADPDPSGSLIASCIDLWTRGAVIAPRYITTIREGKFLRVTGAEFEEEPPEEWLDAAPESVGWEQEEEAPF
jgi:DNA repair protein RadD